MHTTANICHNTNYTEVSAAIRVTLGALEWRRGPRYGVIEGKRIKIGRGMVKEWVGHHRRGNLSPATERGWADSSGRFNVATGIAEVNVASEPASQPASLLTMIREWIIMEEKVQPSMKV